MHSRPHQQPPEHHQGNPWVQLHRGDRRLCPVVKHRDGGGGGGYDRGRGGRRVRGGGGAYKVYRGGGGGCIENWDASILGRMKCLLRGSTEMQKRVYILL